MPTEIIYTLEDADGDEATTSARFTEDAADTATLEELALAYGGALTNIVIGSIKAAIAVLKPVISGLTSNILQAGSAVERQGKFEFVTADGHRVKFNLPCLLESTGQGAGSDSLNLADPEVAALISAFEDGIDVGAVTIQPCDIGENPIVGTLFARESHKNSGARS